MKITKLLKPEKIAIIGASENKTVGGYSVRLFKENCQSRINDLYIVNPKRDRVQGLKCYPSISEIPENIDLAVICSQKQTVEQLIKDAAAKGAGGAIVYASGYGETGKKQDLILEKRLGNLCRKLDIALMGPNCGGYLNFIDGIFAYGFMIATREHAGKIGLVAQSGQVAQSLMDSSKGDASYVISSGNSNIVTIEDYLEFLVNDDHTSVVAGYIEGVKNPSKFIKVLQKAVTQNKPIVLLKAGRSEKGRIAAASHTGSMSGSDKSFDAIFNKFGVIRVDNIEELIATSAALTTIPSIPKRNAMVAVTASGSENAICADICAEYGFNFPEFEKETTRKLISSLPDFATVHNPLDTTAAVCYNPDVYADVLDKAINDPKMEMMIIGLTITEVPSYQSTFHMTDGIVKFMQNGNQKPIFVIPVIETGRCKELIDKLKNVGVPVLPMQGVGYKIIKYILDYGSYSTENRTLEVAIPLESFGGRYTLGEHQSKQLLSELGIPIPKEEIVTCEEEAVKVAEQIGFPLVMKIESADIIHKSDVDCVKLNIGNIDQVRINYHEILANARNYIPNAKINGVTIQEMLPAGLEVIIGVNTDPQFGPMVLFGLGGINVELFKDVSLYPVPFGRKEALWMINNIKSSKLLYGYRGGPKFDVDALADTLVAVSDFAKANKNRLVEMDINPLFVYENNKGVAAADGLVIFRDKAKGHH